MSHSSHTGSPRANSITSSGSSNCLLYVESLEERRLLSVNGLSSEQYQLFNAYYVAQYSVGPPQVQTLDSLLNRDVKPIAGCPDLYEVFCLPNTITSDTSDGTTSADVGLDDDWFTIDSSKRTLLDRSYLP